MEIRRDAVKRVRDNGQIGDSKGSSQAAFGSTPVGRRPVTSLRHPAYLLSTQFHSFAFPAWPTSLVTKSPRPFADSSLFCFPFAMLKPAHLPLSSLYTIQAGKGQPHVAPSFANLRRPPSSFDPMIHAWLMVRNHQSGRKEGPGLEVPTVL